MYELDKLRYFIYNEIEFREQNNTYLKPGHITVETVPHPSEGILFSTIEVLSDNEFKIKALLE